MGRSNLYHFPVCTPQILHTLFYTFAHSFSLWAAEKENPFLGDGGATGLNSYVLLNSPLASSLDCNMFAKPLRFGGGVGVRELFIKLKPNLKEEYFYPREEMNSEILSNLPRSHSQ